jgi:uncharacterized protein (DUF58 family)
LRGRDGSGGSNVLALEGEAHGLAERLPELLIESIRISNTVAHGIHGRRRAGPGETFWQFRQAQSSDAASQIDWRRSASSDHLFIREREWEAAHTIWLWPDLSPSMAFRSHLSSTLKRDRALVLTLALAELFGRGGERVALLGLTRPTANRKAATKIAEAIAANPEAPVLKASLPPPERLSRFSGLVLIGDFLDPPDLITERFAALGAGGVTGHLVQVLDPAEETLPYAGRTEFIGVEGPERWIADRAETLRDDYRKALIAHRAKIEQAATRLGWSFLVHHTDRPAAEILLSLMMRFASGASHDYRWTAPGGAGATGNVGAAT